MNLIVDTNILVRAAIDDNPQQSTTAREAMAAAATLTIPSLALCEFVWVMMQSYRKPRKEVAGSVRLLLTSANTVVDRTAVDAGLAMLDAGGDFADGVIAVEGERLGGRTFATFDRKAARIFKDSGRDCLLLAAD